MEIIAIIQKIVIKISFWDGVEGAGVQILVTNWPKNHESLTRFYKNDQAILACNNRSI